MKEIGGYIELGDFKGKEYHPEALALNCGRACLAYLIRKRGIKKIYLPHFLCSTVKDTCINEGVQCKFYHIDEKFRPQFDQSLDCGEWLYIVNFYGQLKDEELRQYREKFQRIIADYTQAFYHAPIEGVDTIYTCRKFFGVADGAYLHTQIERMALEQDYSYDRMRFLLGRFEKSASEFYEEYVSNDHQLFADGTVKVMSKLTHNLLRVIDYESIAERRTENFSYLHKNLREINKLKLQIPYGAYMYPLYLECGMEVRKKLQEKKIYVPTLWPNVLCECDKDRLEYKYAAKILPLPIDQRYAIDDMQYVIEEIRSCIDVIKLNKEDC